METPLISVLLPVYNGEVYLKQAIDSILNQTINDFELIIINDASTDSTERIIMSYNDKRIKYIKNDINLKLIKTLNKGIAIARGRYISRMDADDIAVKNLFQKQVEAFENDQTIDIVNICTYELLQNGTLYRPFPLKEYVDSSSLKYIELFENHITHPGVMVKADLMKKYMYKDDDTVINFEDVDLWIRMLWDGCKCITLQEYLLYYRINSAGVTRSFGTKRNVLRVQYNNKFLYNKFNIEVPSDLLYYLYGCVNNNYCKPFKIDNLIKVISRQIIENKLTRKKFMDWYHLRMCLASLQIMQRASVHNKIVAFMYLITHISNLFNRIFIKYTIDKFINKWVAYENSDAG